MFDTRPRPPYRDRPHAGKVLARSLAACAGQPDAIVLALPRGGVPVGYALARALDLPLDVVVVRKLGLPGMEEFAMGAVGGGGVCVLQDEVIKAFDVAPGQLEAAIAQAKAELSRRERAYRQGRLAPRLQGRCVLLVDDGLATGASMRAAIQVARRSGAARVIVAAPVGAPDTCASLAREVDALVVPVQPMLFRAVGSFYEQFGQTGDDEVLRLLDLAWDGRRVGRRKPRDKGEAGLRL